MKYAVQESTSQSPEGSNYLEYEDTYLKEALKRLSRPKAQTTWNCFLLFNKQGKSVSVARRLKLLGMRRLRKSGSWTVKVSVARRLKLLGIYFKLSPDGKRLCLSRPKAQTTWNIF